MKWFVLFFLSLYVHLNAVETEFLISEIKAKHIHYNGKEMILEGDVVIHHRFGLLGCQKARVELAGEQQAVGQTMTPDKIFLRESVHIQLQDGSDLHADEADINCVTLEAVFRATAPAKVVYITSLQEQGHGDEKKAATPIKTTSRALRMKMKKIEGKSEYAFSDLQGDGAVSIEYVNTQKSTEQKEPVHDILSHR